jgi:hypothetical protein
MVQVRWWAVATAPGTASSALALGSEVAVRHAEEAGGRPHAGRTDSAAEEASQGLEFGPTVGSTLDPSALAERDPEEAAEVAELPIVERQAHGSKQAGKLADEHLGELGRCPGWGHQLTSVRFEEAGGEP